MPLDTPLFVLPLTALLACVLLHALALRLFPRWGLLDFPERYGLTRARIPYPTGIIPILVFCVLLPVLQPLTLESLAILGAVLILGVFCLIDDRHPLPPLLRFAVQIGVAVLLVACGVRIEAVTNPLPWFLPGATLNLDSSLFFVFSVGFTVIWLVLTVNALNWFDGIPGQVSTISTIGFLTIAGLSLSDRVNQPVLALIAFTLAAISGACLLFDFPPARVLMGDTGAMFFGLMIGVLTIFSGGKVATAFLVLGVPLVDFVFVIARRLRRGQSIIRGNAQDQHLHHRLLRRGWSPRQVIVFTAVIGSSFGVIALFLGTRGKIIAALFLLALMLYMSFYSAPKKQ